MRSVISEDSTDTGHAFVCNIYEGGNGAVFFIREAMNGAEKTVHTLGYLRIYLVFPENVHL